jgi:chorismate mutase
MDIADWRKKIDEIDQKLVELISQRAAAAHEIGKLKRDNGSPIYEPDRESAVIKNVLQANPGPLPDSDLKRIYERIMDVMRQIQVEEIAPESLVDDGHGAVPGDTEIDTEIND